MRRAIWLVLLVLTAAFTAAMVDSLQQGENALIQRRYQEAIPHLQQALAEARPEARDRVLLLLARAQVLAGQPEAGVKTYEQLVTDSPGSPLARKARFSAAEALVQAKRFREAAAIYRDEIEKLVGMARKEEIAATYLSLAEQALGQEPRDFARAVQFFDLAVDLGLSAEKERSVKLLAAESRLKEGNFADAIVRFTPLVKSLAPAQGKLRAMLGLGQSKRLGNDRAGARATLRDLIALDKQSAEAADASYEIALTYGVPAPQPAELDRAVDSLLDLAKSYPAHAKAKVARFLAGQCYATNSRADAALAEVQAFLASSGQEDLPEVPLARAMVGDVLVAQDKKPAAIEAWRAYLKAHPAHQDWERVQRAIVDAEYAIAHAAFTTGAAVPPALPEFAKARELFDAFAKSYPLDARNPEILYLAGEMLASEQKFAEARDAFARCVSKYPNTEASSHAQFRIGEIFEHKTFNYLEALRAYRKVTWGQWAAQAQQRIALLEQKHLHLLTKRTFRTGEPAGFQLTSRNIERVRVRVYRLDLETYFRATHGIGDVRRLDIEVIEPDKTFDSPVKEYKQYQLTQRDIEIGDPSPGAYVVKVDDKELEATTLVLVTDLALITKSSRHELLVFTQNQKEARVEAGVRIVVSDGGKVLAEGTTGADGCFVWKGKELQTSAALRVFAVAASGSGASSLDLTGLGYAPGLAAKGYLFTDRPAYQPGQLVHVKGIVREVKDGLYTLPAQPGYRLQIVSAGGRLMLQRAVEFTAFGTFACDLPLPPDAELGDWRIAVDRQPAGSEAFAQNFTVARYERPRVQLVATPEAAVVYRGEAIRGKLVAKYFFGEPVVGRTIAYSLALPDGGRIEQEGQTNAAGEVAFAFETKEFGEEALAVVDARLVEEDAATRLVVPVVTTEFQPVLATVRPLYLAGENFDVQVTLLDRAGKPLAKEGVLKLLRTEARGGRVHEVPVAEQPFQTAGKDGKVTVAFAANQGGTHLVRLEAKDRFGTLVTGQIAVEVSGQDDAIKLRLLGDRQSYKVGEKALVKVVNRAGARLVLETLQGDGVLARRSFLLQAGESVLELPLEALHAPNFALALAMIDGDKLHTAERELLVTRDLAVAVKPAQEVLRPGEEVEVEITTRDPKGGGVAAEVALAAIDEAVFTLYAERAPAISQYFYGHRRETQFRTTSSCTWSYEGKAQAISKEIAAEERREWAAQQTEMTNVLDAEKDLGELEKAKFRDQRAGKPGEDPARPRARRAGEQQVTRSADRAPGAPPTAEGFQAGLGGGGAKAGGRPQDKQANEPQAGLATHGFDVFHVGGKLEDQLALARVSLGFFAANSAAPDLAQPLSAPRTDFSETGAWVSSVVTGADGTARVKIRLPDSTTAFRLSVRGATQDTYVGEGTAQVRTQKELQAALTGPLALTEGDRSSYSVRVHNLAADRRTVETELAITSAAKTTKSEQRLEIDAHREGERAVELTATGAEDLTLTLAARSGAVSDALSRTVAVLPYGIELRDGKSGTVTQDTLLELSLPAGRELTRLGLAIEIGADPGRDLVALALGLGYRPWNCVQTETTVSARASRGLSALLAWQHVEQSGRGTPADLARLRGVVDGLIAQLASTQMQDGAWSWIGGKVQDVRSTAQVTLFLALARKRGLATAEAPLHRATEWLLKLRGGDQPARARATLALAFAARARFEDQNALHRARMNLDLESLARLGLSWLAVERKDLAREVTEPLRQKLQLTKNPDAQRIEAVGLAVAMLLGHDPRDPDGARGLEWLDAQRQGASYATAEATAAALWAFAAAGGTSNAGAARADVTVAVNGKTLASLPANALQTQTTFQVPAADIKERGNQIAIQVKGQGRVQYAAMLTGFAKGFHDVDRRADVAWLERRYLAAPLRFEHKVVPQGFSVVSGRYESFENQITVLEAGKTARVRVSFSLRDEVKDRMTPLVVEEPLPAGCTVLRDTIRGGYDHVDIAPDRLTFYYRESRWADTVQYELQGRFPGKYRTLPLRVYGALRPDLIAHGEGKSLEVSPRGTPAPDTYKLTPDELYHLGKAHFDRNELEPAGQHLLQLLAGWKLRDDIHKEVARMMLFVAVSRNDAAQIVRFFEDLKDRYPELVIPFDKIVAVGKAYLDQGEFERALMVFRAAAEASFLKEAAVATTLEGLGEQKASIRFLRRLLGVYPDLNTIRAALYGLAQKEATLAAQIPDGAPLNDKVGRREELRAQALHNLREFLVLYPEDVLAEEVSFAWATTHLEAKETQQALDVARAALQRYPGSTFEDELLYTTGYCLFALGKHEEAFSTLQRVASASFPRPDGQKGESENKWHAVYLQGQIHHALGAPDKALASYEQVKDRFSDAEEASDYFLRKTLALPEVTAIPLADKVEVALTYRNVKQVEVKVYRVDLMRLYLLEKSLNNIRGVELHGISPYATRTVELGDGRDFRSKEKKLALELKDPGAYLVVVRGEDLLATGMLLRTDLKIEAQESLDVGRIRVNVKKQDGFLASAHVKVVGSSDQQLKSGDTDLRGIYVADGLVGQATVIVKKDDEYAFYRGAGIHQPQMFQPAPNAAPAQQLQQVPQLRKGKQFEALDNNFNFNIQNRGRQVQWLQQEVLNKQQKGVEVGRTK